MPGRGGGRPSAGATMEPLHVALEEVNIAMTRSLGDLSAHVFGVSEAAEMVPSSPDPTESELPENQIIEKSPDGRYTKANRSSTRG